MQALLIETGLAGAKLAVISTLGITADSAVGSEIGQSEPPLELIAQGERLRTLLDLVSAIELGLRAFGRRNRSIRDLLQLSHPASDSKIDPRAGLLPQFLIEDGSSEIPCWTEHECNEYRTTHDVEFQAESEFDDEVNGSSANVPAPLQPDRAALSAQQKKLRKVRRLELHEVKALNKHLARLRDDFGLRPDVLLPREVTGDEPPPRFNLHRDGEVYPLLELRALVATVRKIGEKGMKITRFKGLGEMDAEQLWETTMDPARRTLMQVHLDDTAAANDLFTTLMGDDVEPRREFIEKHALEVKNLDV
jgi:DNA gyrase subunit B